MERVALNRRLPLIVPGTIIRYAPDGIEMVTLKWGLRPTEPEGRPFEVVRAEGRQFATHRCLIPATEFHLTHERQKYRFTLADGDWFYFAGIWRPATPQWPAAYAALTIAANDDVAPYHDRQMAVIRRGRRMDWLDARVSEEDLLRPFAAGSFAVEALEEAPIQAALL
jgi:putative SOS response-associated peptidase YedK